MTRYGRIVVLTLAVVLLGQLVGSAATWKTFETITVADTAIGLTSTTYAPTARPQMQKCMGTVETAEIRVRWDGTNPTSSVGTVLSALDVFYLDTNEDISQLKMIRTGATSATVTMVCWTN